jgi:alpha-N-acetylglucosamine transferase
VIGGLLVATLATLFFVPVVYSMLRTKDYEGDPDERFEKEANQEYKAKS